MPNETLLTLHCPRCKQITEVITEGENLVCLDCGFHFDEKTAARFFTPATDEQPTCPAGKKFGLPA